MSVLSTIENWLSPITDPLSELPGHLNTMQQTHLNSLDDFESFMSDLTVTAPPDEQWTGISAEEAVQLVQEYLASARAFSAPGETLDAVSQATNTAIDDVEVASETLASDVADDTVITEVTAAVDVADVAQAGLDPVTDLAGIILTVVDIALYFSALVAFGWAIYQATQTLINALQRAENQPHPKLPKQPVALSQTAEQIARKYQQAGIDIDAQMIQDLLDEGYTPEQIDQIIRNLQRLYGKQGVKDALKKLLTLGLNPAQTVAITNTMTQLNNGTSTEYLKGKPGDNVYADILAAIQVQLIQETKAQISTLQSAIQKARAKKGSNLTQQEIIDAVNSTGMPWSSLPAELQRFLLGKSGVPYKYAYGLLIEHMAMDKFKAEYPSAYAYYTTNLDFKYREQFGKSGLYPDFQFTENGQTVIEDITSQGYMSTKQKYLSLPDILIAIGY